MTHTLAIMMKNRVTLFALYAHYRDAYFKNYKIYRKNSPILPINIYMDNINIILIFLSDFYFSNYVKFTLFIISLILQST